MAGHEQEDSGSTTPYEAAGGIEGITKLVNEFYVNMDTLPEAETIRSMHPTDLTESRKKLTYFLSGWLGGPKLFQQHYGPISIPVFHKQFPIGYEERDLTAALGQSYADYRKRVGMLIPGIGRSR